MIVADRTGPGCARLLEQIQLSPRTNIFQLELTAATAASDIGGVVQVCQSLVGQSSDLQSTGRVLAQFGQFDETAFDQCRRAEGPEGCQRS